MQPQTAAPWVPEHADIKACLPWLEAELTLVDPALIVCLGATAARALLGSAFRVTKQRGEVLELATPVGIRPVQAGSTSLSRTAGNRGGAQ